MVGLILFQNYNKNAHWLYLLPYVVQLFSEIEKWNS